MGGEGGFVIGVREQSPALLLFSRGGAGAEVIQSSFIEVREQSPTVILISRAGAGCTEEEQVITSPVMAVEMGVSVSTGQGGEKAISGEPSGNEREDLLDLVILVHVDGICCFADVVLEGSRRGLSPVRLSSPFRESMEAMRVP